MAEIDPRKMALQIAGLRANETHLPDNERVFQDPYAEYFFSDETRKLFRDPCRVKAEIEKYEQMMPGVNGAIVARIKFIDECLTGLVAKGLEQLVVIGAGYDTRSYRIREVKENLSTFSAFTIALKFVLRPTYQNYSQPSKSADILQITTLLIYLLTHKLQLEIFNSEKTVPCPKYLYSFYTALILIRLKFFSRNI